MARQKHTRVCEQCGAVEETYSDSPICMKCYKANVNAVRIKEQIQVLEGMGLTNVSAAGSTTAGHQLYTYTKHGVTRTSTYNNIIAVSKR